jgi:regulator-associated protein of mTOR
MALGDLMVSRLVHSSSSSPSPSPSRSTAAAPAPPLPNHHHHLQNRNHAVDGLLAASGPEPRNGLEAAAEVEKPAPVAYLPQVVVLCEQRHEPDGIDEAAAAAAGPSTSGLVSKWRPKDRVMDVMQFADAVSSAASDIILGNSLDSVTPGLGGS